MILVLREPAGRHALDDVASATRRATVDGL